MRTRLREAVLPKTRIAGGVMVGVLCTVLLLVSFFTDISFRPDNDRLFSQEELQRWRVTDLIVSDGEKDPFAETWDEQALLEYVASLELSRHTKALDPYSEPRHVQIVFKSPEKKYIVTLGGTKVRVYRVTLVDGEVPRGEMQYYTMEEELDMEYILSCLHG